jgi:RimJ/RimL family protein N-acetyltransferase
VIELRRVWVDGCPVAVGAATDRRDPRRPGRFEHDVDVAELSYLFLPEYWNRGYATEAAAAVVLCTQAANTASVRLARRLGFHEVERFVEFGAEQWFGVRLPRPGSTD